jgi:AmmeMemoRadiSam system protein B/AmmeMemoRadiSam system protein A
MTISSLLFLTIAGEGLFLPLAICQEGPRWLAEGKMGSEEIRKPAVAGTFYPGNAKTLAHQVKDFLSRASKEEISGDILALVAPHAGYMYSGLVAAHAYKMVTGMKFDAVIVVAPSHRFHFQGASLYDRGGYETPLGFVPVEKEICRRLRQESDLIQFVPQAHSQEHSLEVQLPFLQEVLGSFHVVPIVMGDQGYRNCVAIGQAMAKAVQGKKVLFVASTDLSHYHPYDAAVKMDRVILDSLERFDARQLSRELESGQGEACGGGPVMAVMVAAKELGANRAKVLKYLNSGDVTGDRSGVVGYAAAVFYRNDPASAREGGSKKAGIHLGLTEEEKRILHQIAQAAIESRLRGGEEKLPEVSLLSSHLKEKRGAFVSLHKSGRLRGCIGLIHPAKPLHQTVEEMARAAAFEDPRFAPVAPEELKDLEVEISVLTPLQRMKDVKEIEIGKHGLYIRKGFCSGLLLPQVATEYGWGPETFLEETCRKAGLPRKAWKEKDAEIYLFSADIF